MNRVHHQVITSAKSIIEYGGKSAFPMQWNQNHILTPILIDGFCPVMHTIANDQYGLLFPEM